MNYKLEFIFPCEKTDKGPIYSSEREPALAKIEAQAIASFNSCHMLPCMVGGQHGRVLVVTTGFILHGEQEDGINADAGRLIDTIREKLGRITVNVIKTPVA